MSAEDAIENGYAWESVVKSYEFISCKLIDNSVQFPNKVEQVINNTNKTNVSIRKSIF